MSVMGWVERRQLSEPGSGLSTLLIGMFGLDEGLCGFGLRNALLLTGRADRQVVRSLSGGRCLFPHYDSSFPRSIMVGETDFDDKWTLEADHGESLFFGV